MLFRKQWKLDNFSNVGFSRLWRRYTSMPGRAVVDMAAKDGELRVFIVAGEVSGDSIGSRLMASLKKHCSVPTHFSGVGGSMMSRQGLNSLFPMEHISVMGIWELLPHLNKFRLKLKETVEAAFLFQPHVIVTVDSKGFSFRLLKQLRASYSQRGLVSPVHFHYVAPSFWAWRGGEARLKGLAEFVDQVFCILPNEEEVCKSNGLDATFVGHPILEDIVYPNWGKDVSPCEWKVDGDCEDFRSKNAIPAGTTVISLLPGSRLQEVTRMLPIFANTMELLKESIPELMSVIHVAPNQHVEKYITEVVHKWPVPVLLLPGGSPKLKYDAFSASRVALCASGTVALELQLARLPCIVAYRAHFLTEWFIRYKAKISYISLPNILLDSAVIPEALFEACTPTKLAPLLMELIHDRGPREEQIIAAEKIIRLLYPSEMIITNLLQQDSRLRFPDCTPSMIAASTILHYVKPR
ncbi:probable lipid-A-disaccharide synthase, mitochondrial isoform X1 [Juglans microcarpa x Juglans regia]|uniref:probable lipid-A-disaccharide synthase, mitochondrial isoform X1 n=1 Tax=Juglans microcarpa x Juglans regia TaxID=2249226 RepID=UPI001B7DF475|nr:probable lipid-A-disaccharide synthase, mitochondrial isoform X1 [Juglans microcarpa x Juglans regia]XP_041008948.1 probable lipid-A-disaccharide synthase, mitochondrial isoform X1 [Juglans microcarpa x Juglans regia]XP_041008949.1 probable lipid-A-disaccharide synthase, mitochondrial isoform X1 [Juglans microcarpa x Juglans regia]XP_041008950.1 probable lipid-A-disaccharide synthase, mitochondrial isoform X1 [Juglans microcarpa x Juglans regia]